MEVEELSSLSYAMAIVHNMKDGDYKDLLNKGNNKKRVGGNLIVEIVHKDRKSSDVYLPENGDDVQVWVLFVPEG
jgi:hypothetical protein